MSLTRRTSESVSLDMSLNLVDSLVDALSSSVLYVVSSIRTAFTDSRSRSSVFFIAGACSIIMIDVLAGVVFTTSNLYNRLGNNDLVHQEHAPATQSEEMSEWYLVDTPFQNTREI